MASENFTGSLERLGALWGANPAWLLAAIWGAASSLHFSISAKPALLARSPHPFGASAGAFRQAALALSGICWAAATAAALDPSVPAARMTPVARTVAAPPMPAYDVRKFGAKGDGKSYDTVAIQSAIDACAGSGGSVILSNGTYLTAQLQLKGGMTFYINRSAVLLGGTAPADYPVLVPSGPAHGMVAFACRRSILYANQADRLIIDGGGTIDGQCKFVQMSGAEPERPSLLRIFQSTDVAVRNVVMKNPRMWTQVYDHCEKLIIENVKVSAPPDCKNLDGMDICDSRDVIIRNNEVIAEDDAICLKSHGPDGLKNITIENNVVHCHNANGIKIGTMTKGPIENIRIVNNTILYARLGGLCLESILGSVMKNVLVQGLDIHKTGQPIFIRLGPRNPRLPGGISDIAIERVRILETHTRTAPACTITGMAGVKVRGVRLKDMYVEMPGGMTKMPGRPPEMDGGEYPQSNIFGHTPGYAFYVRYADGVVFENVTIRAAANDVRPWLATEDAGVETINCVELKKLASYKEISIR